MQWFYLDEDQEQQPFEDSALTGLIGGGTITSKTLVWNESLPNWTPAAAAFPSEFPEESVAELPEISDAIPAKSSASSTTVSAAQQKTAPTLTIPKKSPVTGSLLASNPIAKPADIEHVASIEAIKDLASYLNASAKWMKLLGILSIIGGVINCLTVVGLVVGWLPIWTGILLMKGADAARYAEMTGDQNALAEALDRLRLYFKIFGILTFVYIIFVAIIVTAALALGGFAAITGAAAASGGATP